MPADEITDLAEERRKRGKDGSGGFHHRMVCPECNGELWYVFHEGGIECATCYDWQESIRVIAEP